MSLCISFYIYRTVREYTFFTRILFHKKARLKMPQIDKRAKSKTEDEEWRKLL